MKIKIQDRAILFSGALLTIAASIMLFVQGLREKNALFIICAVFLAAFGGYLIAFPFLHEAKRDDFVIQRTDSGELRIAVKAIENQVQKCVELHEEIQSSSMKIVNSREGVVVDLTVTLANNISIPLAVASLQKQIKQYLVASSGIEVKEVRVSVESTQDTALSEETDAEDESAEKTAAREEKKAPMHQRLFGRPDEPAIVPEPPREEEPLEDEETATEAETEEAAEVEAAREQPGLIPDEPKQEGSPEEPAIEEENPKKKPEPLPESDIKPESEEKTDE